MIYTKAGPTSLYGYLLGVSLFFVYSFLNVYLELEQRLSCYVCLGVVVLQALMLRLFLRRTFRFQVAIRGYILGSGFSLALFLISSNFSFSLIGWYILALTFFHWSEFFVTAVFNSDNVTLDSFMLDHSPEYHAAAVASCLEFFLEWYFAPHWKQFGLVSNFGMILVIGGEFLRKLAMITASKNFNHYVQWYKKSEHQLVTSGIYGLCRHPAYVGWFYFSIGTQIMICNPFCSIVYAIVSWRFFSERIYHEETTLVSFFDPDYEEYQKRVPTGLPFIYGFINTGKKVKRKISSEISGQ